MLIENSVVIADFINGIFLPLKVLTVVCFMLGVVIFAYTYIEDKPKARWWLLPICLEMMFALWFFSTFSLVTTN